VKICAMAFGILAIIAGCSGDGIYEADDGEYTDAGTDVAFASKDRE